VIAVVWWARRRSRHAAGQGFDATIVTAAGSTAGFPDLAGSPPGVSQTAGRYNSDAVMRPAGSKGAWRLDELSSLPSAGSDGLIGTRTASAPHMQQPSAASQGPVVEVLLAPPGSSNPAGTSSGIGSCPSPRQQQQMQQLQQRASATLTSLATGSAVPRSSAVLSQAPGSPSSPVSPHAAARVARLPALPNEVLKRMQNVSGVAGSSSSDASGSPWASDASRPHPQQQ
jgi:hypothetical protein